MKGAEVRKSISIANRGGKFLASDLWIGHFCLKVKSKNGWCMVPICLSHSGMIFKNSEGNNFPLGRTVCSAPDNSLYVEEKGTEDENMWFLAVTNGFAV